ncbi:MAG: lytic transglycosylase domain-containing protein, partial [Thiotrichaceae bacterium]
MKPLMTSMSIVVLVNLALNSTTWAADRALLSPTGDSLDSAVLTTKQHNKPENKNSTQIASNEKSSLTPTGSLADVPNIELNKDKIDPKKANTLLAGNTNFAVNPAFSGCSAMNTQVLHRRAQPHLASISTYSQQYGVDAAIVKAVIAVESCYNTAALSPKGAQGLMQLIPDTAARFGVTNAFDSSENIRGGTKYLSWLINRYNGDFSKAVAAYNAGEGAVDRYQGIPPYAETQQYVQRVLSLYNRLSTSPVP